MATPLDSETPTNIPDDPINIDSLAEKFSALADATRLRILQLLLTNGEMCVCEFMPLLDLTQSNVSFHLKALKYAGFLTSRKEGRWVFYSLNRKAFEKFQAEFKEAYDLSRWTENNVLESAYRTTRMQLACQQQQDQSQSTD